MNDNPGNHPWWRPLAEHGQAAIALLASEMAAQLAEMQGDVGRAQTIFGEAIGKLVASFHAVNDQAERQRRLVGRDSAGGGALGELEKLAARVAESLQPAAGQSPEQCLAEAGRDIERLRAGLRGTAGELDRVADGLAESVQQAVVALQFHDMLTQLFAHIGKRVDFLSEVAADGGAIGQALQEAGDQDSAIRRLDALRDHIETLSQRFAARKESLADNPVRQAGFSSGDVELF